MLTDSELTMQLKKSCSLAFLMLLFVTFIGGLGRKRANETLKTKYSSGGIDHTFGNANFTPKRATLAVFTRHVLDIKLDANSSEGREKGVPFLLPSESTPFVAFHLRKTGGSTFRSQLFESAKAHNISSFIPCHDGLHCSTYGPPEKAGHPFAILAGHFYFPSVSKWLGLNPPDNARPRVRRVSDLKKFNCFAILRNPVDRVRSSWNFRFLQTSAAKGFFNHD
jgi:hypothetical protein